MTSHVSLIHEKVPSSGRSSTSEILKLVSKISDYLTRSIIHFSHVYTLFPCHFGGSLSIPLHEYADADADADGSFPAVNDDRE
jgi:hypothetical protein